MFIILFIQIEVLLMTLCWSDLIFLGWFEAWRNSTTPLQLLLCTACQLAEKTYTMLLKERGGVNTLTQTNNNKFILTILFQQLQLGVVQMPSHLNHVYVKVQQCFKNLEKQFRFKTSDIFQPTGPTTLSFVFCFFSSCVEKTAPPKPVAVFYWSAG